ncbi:hypothetical protein CTAYLR_003988 [Chrysophaeum taylorii]|uniref:Uncharacterized protein n=1 Tax=Chrysophaeum taylorii TaxID=2483200 RepID=A0AAD7U7S4_9STRA|nr:hypothetical protein CTAYLR_003988 [Chrysophaeum taylorii]
MEVVGRVGCEGIPKGVAWSPDGTCLLTAVEDTVRVLEVTTPALELSAGEEVYDYAWYPLMDSRAPVTCCLAASSRDHPIQLWDAYTGDVRATYCAKSASDEQISALSLSFSPRGELLYGGYDRSVRVFDTATGASHEVARQKGLIGALDAVDEVVAAGSYGGKVELLDGRGDGAFMALSEPKMGGVTMVRFEDSGLWTGSRRDDHLRFWDLRTGRVSRRLRRSSETNQRLGFDVRGTALVTGSDAGCFVYWDDDNVDRISEPDPINGAAFHPYKAILALATGQRRYDAPPPDNAIILWTLPSADDGPR